MVISNYKKEEKEKVKKEKEETKIKEKEEKIKVKEQAKKQKEEEKWVKKNVKQQHTKSSKIHELMGEMEEENTVMIPGCCEILKMGLNKGNVCNQKIFQEGRCKRHFQKNGNMKETEKIV
jgi:hypothetical protein